MKIDTAVVLAGGSGVRLKPLTNDFPKGMVKVCEKPLLEWIIEWLRGEGVRNIILGVAYLKEKIIEYFGNGSEFGVNIRYSVHSVGGGTGEGFRLAINKFVNKNVLFAMNGDQITDLRLNDLTDLHIKHNPIATMVVNNPHCPYGHVQVNDKYDVTGFTEKPFCPRALCNTGIYVFNREILPYLPKSGDVEKTAFSTLAKLNRLKIYPFKGLFVTVNTHKDLIEAEKVLRMKHK